MIYYSFLTRSVVSSADVKLAVGDTEKLDRKRYTSATHLWRGERIAIRTWQSSKRFLINHRESLLTQTKRYWREMKIG